MVKVTIHVFSYIYHLLLAPSELHLNRAFVDLSLSEHQTRLDFRFLQSSLVTTEGKADDVAMFSIR